MPAKSSFITTAELADKNRQPLRAVWRSVRAGFALVPAPGASSLLAQTAKLGFQRRSPQHHRQQI